MRRFLALAVSGWLCLTMSARGAGYGDWAAIIVAGDWHAHSGAPSEVFDNARRDLGMAFRRIGFAPDNILEFSVRPERYPGQNLLHSDKTMIADELWDLSNRATGGCLIYFTSHGSPDGVVVDDTQISPDSMARIIGNACGDRPTVVIIAACYSGVFVPPLAAPNRMVFTAARPDRPSFGCGEEDKYTFFDTCMLASLPGSSDFPGLARGVQACVAAREKKEDVYPSEPQLSIGDKVAAELPSWR
ncbi:MAG TPA: C13 family peptidase [Rhizomicrobium sp.]